MTGTTRLRPPRGSGCRSSVGSPCGQATTETAIVMLFLLLLVYGIVQVSMLAATKFVVDYAAFAASRSALTMGPGHPPLAAAQEVMHNLRWWQSQASPPIRVVPAQRGRRQGYEVEVRVPHGLPMFDRTQVQGGLRILGFAPVAPQPGIAAVSSDNGAP